MEAVAAVNVVLALFCLLVHPWPDSVNSAGTVGFPSLSEIQDPTGDTTTSIPDPLVLLYPAVGFTAPCLLTGWVFRGRRFDDIEFIEFVPVFGVWRNSTETVSPTDYFLVADTGSLDELIQLSDDFFQYNLSEPVEVLEDDVLGVKIEDERRSQTLQLVFLSQLDSSEPIAFFIRDTSLSTFDTSSGQVNSRLPLVSPLLSSIPSTVALPSSSSDQLPSTTSQSVDDVTPTSSGAPMASESAEGTSSASVSTTSSPPPTVSLAALPVVAIAAPVAGAGVLLVLALALIVVCGALVAVRRRQRRKLNLSGDANSKQSRHRFVTGKCQ